MSDKTIVEEYPFKSKSSDSSYMVLRYDDSSLSCNCPGWRFSPKRFDDGHRECRHTDYVKGLIEGKKLTVQEEVQAIKNLQETRKMNQQEKRIANFATKPQQSIKSGRYFSLDDEQ